jgi:hypothetical protein
MSATDYSTMPAAELFTEFERLTKELDAVRKALKKVMKVKRTAKTDPSTGETVKRAPTAWIAWTKHVKDTYAEEYAEFAAAQETKKGVLPAFAKQCRDESHAEEWAEFETAHKVAHPPAEKAEKAPKAAKATSAAVAALLSDTEDEGVSVRSGAGAGAYATASAVAIPKASSVGKTKKAAKEEKPKKEKKPATKAAAAAVAALLSDSEDEAPKKVVREHAKPAIEEDEEEELTPFTYKGVVYLQNNLGHAWVQTKAGEQGKWAGVFNGTALDMTVPNPYEDDE